MGTHKVDEMKGIFKRSLKNGMIVVILSISQIPLSFAGWEVTWIDRFDETGVNLNNWTPQIQANYNNEVQCYTDDDSSAQRNYEASDGTLKIIARKQDISCPGLGGENKSWTSGRLNSKDKAEFLYGRIEARIRFSELKGGSWPAFWMLENRIAENPFKGDNDTVNWPNPGAGEIDVWEWFSNDGDRYITNFFNVGNCGSEVRVSYPGGAPDVLAFHTYAIEWTADNIKFFFNDTVVVEQDLTNCAQYEEPMFILLNVAMGGNLGGAIDPQLNKATMEVDYVAHCVKSDLNAFQECNESTPLIIDEDNDGVSTALDQCPNTPEGTVVDQKGCELVTQPQVAAPDPQALPQQVISLFSDSYSNIGNIDYNPNWQQATQVTQIEIAGNNILKYAGLNYQGTDFADNKQDVSNMDNVHLDYWTYNSTELKFFLISPGPRETHFVIDVKQQGWQNLVIPLSRFLDVDLSDIFQLKVEGNGTVYLDNIYFSSDSEVETDGDMDGVQDNDDQCANTPTGVEVDAAGCALELNIAPTVSLIATQGGDAITSVNTDAGSVIIEANVVDENQGDEHTYVWTVSGISTFENNDNVISFDPSDLANVQISITVEVYDSAQPSLSDETSITLSVEAPSTPVTPETPNSDSGGGSINLFLLLGLVLLHTIRIKVFEPKL
jgi:beta-glucanase (GH16 family)